MRISAEEKEKLREQILAKGLASLKKGGFQGMPVDKIMKDVGLTSGALYSHFKSKEDFFAQVVLREFNRLIEFHTKEINENPKKALKNFLERYLSMNHVDRVETGCTFVALGSDMHRMSAATREKFEEKIETLLTTLAKGLSSGTEEQRLAKMRFIYSSMIGTLTVARTLKNPEAIEKALQATKKQLLEML